MTWPPTWTRQEYREDGWPLCPQCRDDELMSMVPPSSGRQPQPTDRMKCLRCRWSGVCPPMKSQP